MPKKKHRRFVEINTFSNVVQPEFKFPVSNHPLKGNWRQGFFHNNNPVILEIGCGKGEYTLGLAHAYPFNNFIGIDIKGNRLWVGAKEAIENAMFNAGFLRMQAERLGYIFEKNEIDGIWITFPDPQPNKPREKKRLTSIFFLNLYRDLLKPGAPIYLKTDNFPLYEYTLEVIESEKHNLHFATDDLYGNSFELDPVILNIRTYYEKKYLEIGKKICLIKFSLDDKLLNVIHFQKLY